MPVLRETATRQARTLSADNFYVIYRSGLCFVPVMYFASGDEPDDDDRIPSSAPRFLTLDWAITYCEAQYAEYGYRIHPECWSRVE